MYGSEFHGSNYYASLYYGALRGDADALAALSKLSTRDIQYEALTRVTTPSDTRTMEHAYWYGIFGGRGSTRDVMYEGIIIGLSHPTLKDYYDDQTTVVWPDHNSSEKAYWLKILTENI